MSELWYIAEGDWINGPFDRERFGAEVTARALAPATLVWRTGLAAWTPLGALNAEDRPAPSNAARDVGAEAESLAAPPLLVAVDAAPATSPGRRSWASGLGVGALLTLAVALLYAALQSQQYTAFGQQAGAFHLLSWSTAIGASVIATVLAWRPKARPAPVLRMVSALVCVTALALAFPLSQVSELVGRMGKARASFDGYELRYDPLQRVIVFKGPIGPGLAARFRDMINVHGGALAIDVTSDGGLIDEALATAKIFEDHKDLVLRVRGDCNSACIALVMGAHTRVADVGARFGFHQSATVTNLPGWALRALPEPDGGLRSYVIGRGFPADEFDRLSASSEMQMVPAIRLRRIGLINGLDRGRQPVSDEAAAWFWLASVLPAGSGIRSLAEALGESNNPKLVAAGAEFADLLDKGDITGARSYMAQVTPVAIAESVLSADPELFKSYLRASIDTLDYMAQYEKWTECAGALTGKGIAPSAQLPNNLIEAETSALATVVRSASAAAWRQRALPSWGRRQYARVIDAAAAEMSAQGLLELSPDDPRGVCLATNIVLEKVHALDAERVAVMYAVMAANP
jgi:hypothetical protein